MSSNQGLYQVQKQTQSLVMAPQMRQSLKILQLPAMDLRNAILEELQTNPVLEEIASMDVSFEAKMGTPETPASSSETELNFKDTDYEVFKKLDEDWNDYFNESSFSGNTSRLQEKHDHFLNSLVSEQSLEDFLLDQTRLVDCTENELLALKYLIGSLDDKGFLTLTLEEVVEKINLPKKTVEYALNLLRTFEPVGIGSADLQECLLFQLNVKGYKSDSLPVKILKDHYKLLLRRRIPELSRLLEVDISEIKSAIEVIASLNPVPASKFSVDTNSTINPDVKVFKEDGSWVVTMCSDYIPKLRLSQVYKNLISDSKVTGSEREYIRDKIRSGKSLMHAIDQRQQTIEKIANRLLDFQYEFFEKGVKHLQPLTMLEVADSINVHETTVSRAIANKYIQTPHGLFPFKFFFNTGYVTNEGDMLANKSVQEMIVDIIDTENPSKPLSDQTISNLLAQRDINVARRTVAKYREASGILPTNLRRKYE